MNANIINTRLMHLDRMMARKVENTSIDIYDMNVQYWRKAMLGVFGYVFVQGY